MMAGPFAPALAPQRAAAELPRQQCEAGAARCRRRKLGNADVVASVLLLQDDYSNLTPRMFAVPRLVRRKLPRPRPLVESLAPHPMQAQPMP